MSRSRAAWKYADKSRPFTDPYSGLPLHIIEQIGEQSRQGILGVNHFFDHFHNAVGRIPAAEGTTSIWTLSGTTGAATITFPNTRIGEIAITADATASCNPTLQLGSATAPAHFIYAVGKRLWCFARLKILVVATAGEMFFGLGTPDTSPSVTGTFPSDGIFFHKAATATQLSFDARKDGTSTSKALISGVMVADTYITIGFIVDVKGNILPFQDGLLLVPGVIPAGSANIPGAADIMQFEVGFLGASNVVTLDWLLLAQDN